MATSTNINNLNILTFIKDIYLSLKHIDNCFNSYKDNIDSRLIKLEDNQQTILDRLTNIEQLLDKINLNTQNQVALDKNIENELMQKMNAMNKTSFQEKITLKPEELTFANILENGYSLLDINATLTNTLTKQTLSLSDAINPSSPMPIDATDNTYNNTYDNTYNISSNTYNISSNTLDLTNLDLDNTSVDTTKKETLDNLLF